MTATEEWIRRVEDAKATGSIDETSADEAIRLLRVCDDVFSELHAICHARNMLAGHTCEVCTGDLMLG